MFTGNRYFNISGNPISRLSVSLNGEEMLANWELYRNFRIKISYLWCSWISYVRRTWRIVRTQGIIDFLLFNMVVTVIIEFDNKTNFVCVISYSHFGSTGIWSGKTIRPFFSKDSLLNVDSQLLTYFEGRTELHRNKVKAPDPLSLKYQIFKLFKMDLNSLMPPPCWFETLNPVIKFALVSESIAVYIAFTTLVVLVYLTVVVHFIKNRESFVIA